MLHVAFVMLLPLKTIGLLLLPVKGATFLGNARGALIPYRISTDERKIDAIGSRLFLG